MIHDFRMMQLTYLHVFLCVVGLGAGIFVILGFLSSKRFNILTAAFLFSTILACLTGFIFPYHGVTPGIVIGVLSLIVLSVATYALLVKKLAGDWRVTYVISACVALYFNFFILVAQAFDKVQVLHSIAPSQTSPGFGITQAVLLVIFILLTTRSVKKFHPA
jgi:hypothetical protein